MKFSRISQKKIEELQKKMENLGIHEKDIVEKFIHSRGKGGQKVNKTATCVYLKHIPTGIEIKYQKERLQGLNRFFARRILTEKIEELKLGEKSTAVKKILGTQKQKKKRRKRAMEKYQKIPDSGKIQGT